MIDFFLGPEHMVRGHYGPKDNKVPWNMQSDHRVIQMTLLGDGNRRKKMDTTQEGRGEQPKRIGGNP